MEDSACSALPVLSVPKNCRLASCSASCAATLTVSACSAFLRTVSCFSFSVFLRRVRWFTSVCLPIAATTRRSTELYSRSRSRILRCRIQQRHAGCVGAPHRAEQTNRGGAHQKSRGRASSVAMCASARLYCTQKPKVNLPFRQVFQLTLPKGSLNLSNFL